MTIDIFTMCDYAQESNGKLFVIGAFDTLYAKQFPAAHPYMCLAMRLRFYIHEGGTHSIKIAFGNSDDSELMKPIEGNLDVSNFSGSSRMVHSIFNFINTPIEREGTVNITVSIDGRELLTSPVYIKRPVNSLPE